MKSTYRAFATVLLMFLMISYCSSDYYISEAKPPDYELHQAKIDYLLQKNKDWVYFSPRQVDYVVESSGEGAPCPWVSQVMQPYSIVDEDENYLYPVVQSEKYEQLIKVTQCKESTRPCDQGIGLEKFNMTTECQHILDPMPFHIYDKTMNKIRHIYASVQVCCVCGIIPINGYKKK